MNKFGIFLFTVTLAISSISGETCTKDVRELFGAKDTELEFIDMKDGCTKQTEDQIKKEATAAMKYLSMASYFARDDVNRPGFAKFFFEAASEEREHAFKLIEYLTMRGRYMNDIKGGSTKFDFDFSTLVKNAEDATLLGLNNLEKLTEPDTGRTSGLIALQNALKMEVAVTKSIRKLVEACENDESFNHYHFVDYLTGEFLEEQYKGQRDLAGKISTLGKMVSQEGAHGKELGEFLFDKQLL